MCAEPHGEAKLFGPVCAALTSGAVHVVREENACQARAAFTTRRIALTAERRGPTVATAACEAENYRPPQLAQRQHVYTLLMTSGLSH
jgi:hypothetical protein